jgi:hypothetical protein
MKKGRERRKEGGKDGTKKVGEGGKVCAKNAYPVSHEIKNVYPALTGLKPHLRVMKFEENVFWKRQHTYKHTYTTYTFVKRKCLGLLYKRG